MTNTTSFSDLVYQLTGGGANSNPEQLVFWKDSLFSSGVAVPATQAGNWSSLWLASGNPGAGAAPGGSVVIPTNTTGGGLQQSNPSGGTTKWISAIVLTGAENRAQTIAQVGAYLLYDRLLTISGFSGTSAGSNTVGGALTRYTNGYGNQIWIEIYSALGATPQTATVTYTNDVGGTSTTTCRVGGTGSLELGRIINAPLASGDRGVMGVTSVQLSGSTGTVGNYGVTVAHTLIPLAISAAGYGTYKNCLSGYPNSYQIQTNACLAFAFVPGNTTRIPTVFGMLSSFCE